MSKVDRIRRLLKKGLTVKAIAKLVKVSENYVYVVRWKDQQDNEPGKKPGKKVNKDSAAAEPVNNPDMVNHPPHYKANGIEAIDVIEAFNLNYRLGNVAKYVLRSANKNGVEDLKKAAWYLAREIEKQEGV